MFVAAFAALITLLAHGQQPAAAPGKDKAKAQPKAAKKRKAAPKKRSSGKKAKASK